MGELIREMFSQMFALKPGVQAWVSWMVGVFMVAVFFLRYVEARWILFTFLCTMVLATVFFAIWRTVHMIALAHLICWPPLLFYLLKSGNLKMTALTENAQSGLNPLRLWLFALTLTILVSLPFDLRDVFMVCTGQK